MIPPETFKGILEKLLKLSQQNKVRWAYNGTSYEVSLPESSLTLAFCSPETEPDYFEITLCNKEGNPAEGLVIPRATLLWDLARVLYDDARRCVTGWDKVLADVVKALDSGDRIGWPAPQTVPDVEDDIPF